MIEFSERKVLKYLTIGSLILSLFLCYYVKVLEGRVERAFGRQKQIDMTIIKANNIIEQRTTKIEKKVGVYVEPPKEEEPQK